MILKYDVVKIDGVEYFIKNVLYCGRSYHVYGYYLKSFYRYGNNARSIYLGEFIL